jgi:hypothetical protein
MKESGKDLVETGFKVPSNGWHLVEFGQGIDFLQVKGGGAPYQNDKGFKTYKLPATVKDESDPDNGADISQLVGIEKGGPWMANILACVGLWDAVVAKFPDPNVSVFDQPVMDGIKSRLPGRTCMMKTELDKDGNARIRVMASIAKYKEALAEEKAKNAGAKTGKGADKEKKSEETGKPGEPVKAGDAGW